MLGFFLNLCIGKREKPTHVQYIAQTRVFCEDCAAFSGVQQTKSEKRASKAWSGHRPKLVHAHDVKHGGAPEAIIQERRNKGT
jgi:hypothetical protein